MYNNYKVVMPRFESNYKQFKECDAQLKHEVENNNKLKAQFDEE